MFSQLHIFSKRFCQIERWYDIWARSMASKVRATHIFITVKIFKFWWNFFLIWNIFFPIFLPDVIKLCTTCMCFPPPIHSRQSMSSRIRLPSIPPSSDLSLGMEQVTYSLLCLSSSSIEINSSYPHINPVR